MAGATAIPNYSVIWRDDTAIRDMPRTHDVSVIGAREGGGTVFATTDRMNFMEAWVPVPDAPPPRVNLPVSGATGRHLRRLEQSIAGLAEITPDAQEFSAMPVRALQHAHPVDAKGVNVIVEGADGIVRNFAGSLDMPAFRRVVRAAEAVHGDIRPGHFETAIKALGRIVR